MDLGSMMGKVKEIQEKVNNVKSNLHLVESETEVGAGLIKVKVNGNKEVIDLEIDEVLLKPENKIYIQDLIKSGITKAISDVEVKVADKIKSETAGFIPNIPGFDLSNMM